MQNVSIQEMHGTAGQNVNNAVLWTVSYGTLKRVVWYFEEGGVVLWRGWCGTLKKVMWYFEYGGVILWRGWCGTLNRVVCYFEEGDVVLWRWCRCTLKMVVVLWRRWCGTLKKVVCYFREVRVLYFLGKVHSKNKSLCRNIIWYTLGSNECKQRPLNELVPVHVLLFVKSMPVF